MWLYRFSKKKEELLQNALTISSLKNILIAFQLGIEMLSHAQNERLDSQSNIDS